MSLSTTKSVTGYLIRTQLRKFCERFSQLWIFYFTDGLVELKQPTGENEPG